MIKIEGLNKTYYDSKKNECVALKDINLNLPNKGFISIVGKSGSGKSTLFNILMGLVKPSSGTYEIEGINVLSMNKQKWDEIRSSYFSYIFQDYHLFEKLTLIENLKLSLNAVGLEIENEDEKIDNLLDKLDLINQKFTLVSDLSGGEKQRVAITRALLKGCKVLLADEPTGALDELNSIKIFDCLKEISKDILVVVVTHDLDFATNYSEDIIKLNYGQIVENSIKPLICETTEIPIKKKSFGLKKSFQLSNHFFKKQYYRRIFACFFITICLTVILFMMIWYNFNEYSYTSQTIIDEGITNNFITSNMAILDPNQDLDSFDTNKYKNINFSKTYYGNLDFQINDFKNHTIIENPIFRTIKIGNLSDDEIILTDYQVQLLRNNNILIIENINDAIGKEITIYDYNLTIVDIILTSHIIYNDSNFEVKLITEYDVLITNENTLQKMIYAKEKRKKAINEFGDVSITTDFYLKRFSSHGYVGDLNSIDSGTIALDMGTVMFIFDTYYEDHQEMYLWYNSMIGEDIEISFMYKDLIFNHIYEIGAITFEETRTIYIDDLTFNQIFSQYNDDLEDINFTYAFSSNNQEELSKFLIDLNAENKTYVNHKVGDIISATSFMEAMRPLLNGLFMFILPFILILIFFMTNLSIKNNKKNMGILYSMGVSQKRVLYIYLIENFIILLVSSLISISISIIFQLLINSSYKEALEIEINLINIGFIPIFVMVLSSVIMMLFTMLISMYYLNKQDIVSLIKDSNS